MEMRSKGRIRWMITLMLLSGWSVSVVTASSHTAEVASFFSPLRFRAKYNKVCVLYSVVEILF